MDNFNDILRQNLHSKGLGTKAEASVLITQLQDWIINELPHFSEYIQVIQVKDSEIICEVIHSIAAQELQGKANDLKEYANSLESTFVESMRIIRK